MGRLVVFEGIDGSGKSTQVGLLAARLRALQATVETTEEPTRSGIGEALRLHFEGVEAAIPVHPAALPYLVLADRAAHVEDVVIPALASADFVVCDRYTPSFVVYQRRTLPVETLAELSRRFPVPDLVVLLDVPAEVAAARIADRAWCRSTFDSVETLAMNREVYPAALRLLGYAHAIVRADLDAGAVGEAVWEAVLPLLDEGVEP